MSRALSLLRQNFISSKQDKLNNQIAHDHWIQHRPRMIFQAWRSLSIQKRGLPLLRSLASSQFRKSAFHRGLNSFKRNVINNDIQRSMNTAAINFQNFHTLKHSFHQWSFHLQSQRQNQIADRFNRLSTLKTHITIWRSQAMEKKEKSALSEMSKCQLRNGRLKQGWDKLMKCRNRRNTNSHMLRKAIEWRKNFLLIRGLRSLVQNKVLKQCDDQVVNVVSNHYNTKMLKLTFGSWKSWHVEKMGKRVRFRYRETLLNHSKLQRGFQRFFDKTIRRKRWDARIRLAQRDLATYRMRRGLKSLQDNKYQRQLNVLLKSQADRVNKSRVLTKCLRGWFELAFKKQELLRSIIRSTEQGEEDPIPDQNNLLSADIPVRIDDNSLPDNNNDNNNINNKNSYKASEKYKFIENDGADFNENNSVIIENDKKHFDDELDEEFEDYEFVELESFSPKVKSSININLTARKRSEYTPSIPQRTKLLSPLKKSHHNGSTSERYFEEDESNDDENNFKTNNFNNSSKYSKYSHHLRDDNHSENNSPIGKRRHRNLISPSSSPSSSTYYNDEDYQYDEYEEKASPFNQQTMFLEKKSYINDDDVHNSPNSPKHRRVSFSKNEVNIDYDTDASRYSRHIGNLDSPSSHYNNMIKPIIDEDDDTIEKSKNQQQQDNSEIDDKYSKYFPSNYKFY
eukprot:TRINITY_DN2246_c0_g4_i1.p1 TRINITY_DN2246_c0_g4~~TRINITY_DN2246_c0_g4_i1.p1  ORF type:complete len:738 (+),score=144.24 TRINITY_DN2246_c0_g4_i1:173-2215(+)